ncbi:organic cation/carnitine transporter 2-like isoform 4-T4 [Spinachia spinachia]
MQDYEESLSFLGTWGPFQKRVFYLLGLTIIPSGYNLLCVIFLLATPSHHCSIPHHSNLSHDWVQAIIPVQFNLVCSDQWKQPLSSVFYFLGGLLGCFVSGQISDRFGRKPVLFGAIIALSIFSSALAFAPSWPVFVVLFFMLGLGQLTCYIVVFVLGSEILMGSTRVIFSSLCLPWAYVFGELMLPVTSYLLSNWRHLSLAMAVPGLACIPLWWLIPESPRWLVSRGRIQEAELLLRSAAVENRVQVPHNIVFSARVEKPTSEKAQSANFLDLLRTPNIRHITLILWFIWFSNSVCYFGLSFNTSSLYGNPFLNYFLLTAVELPAYAACWLAARGLPRRQSYVSFVLLGALALLLIQLTLNSQPVFTLILVLVGKFGLLAGTGVLYMYTSELSPTVIRTTAMSTCAMFSRVGSSLSPYLLQLAVFYQFLPWIVVGALSLLSVVICVLLPETFRQPLPDTIQQVAVTQRFRWPWASAPPLKDDGKSAEDTTVAPEVICTTCL